MTKNRKQGTSPIDISGWSHAQLLNKAHDIWVKGHMISQSLGGDGRLDNLSIITKKTNSAMTNGPEKLAKDETEKSKILKYVVNWKNHPDNGEIKNFANEIIIDVYEKKEGKYISLRNYKFADLAEPSSPTEGIVLNLNSHGEGIISKHFGIDLLFARELILAKGNADYKNIDDLEKRMEIYYLKNGYKPDSEKIKKLYVQTELIATKATKELNLKK